MSYCDYLTHLSMSGTGVRRRISENRKIVTPERSTLRNYLSQLWSALQTAAGCCFNTEGDSTWRTASQKRFARVLSVPSARFWLWSGALP